MEIEFQQENQQQADYFIDDEVKWSIIHYKKEGHSNKKTAQMVAEKFQRSTLSHQTVKAIWEKYKSTGNVNNNWKEGCPRVLNEHGIEALLNQYENNKKDSVQKTIEFPDLNASPVTINRFLLENGLKICRTPT